MERRRFISLAALAALAGCRSDDEAAQNPTERATATPEPTRSPTATPTQTATESPEPTETETPDSAAASQLDEARSRLNRALRRYAAESHRTDPESILETNADTREFVPGRVTGAIHDARQSLDRAERRVDPGQRSTVDDLRTFAVWLEQTVETQEAVIAAAAACRTAASGSVPHDDGATADRFRQLAASAEAARVETDALSVPDAGAGDHLAALEPGDVRRKTDQLRSESDALVRFGTIGRSVDRGIELLTRAKTRYPPSAALLAENAATEFREVVTEVLELDVPDSLFDEQTDLASHASEWAGHARERAEEYGRERD